MPEPRQQRGKRMQELSKAASVATQNKQRTRIWRSRLTGKILALLCLVTAVAVEWELVNLPAGEVTGQFPATVRARDEIVTFTEPASVTGGPFSFKYASPTEAEKVLVDAFFDNAQLSDQTLQAFKSFQIEAPSSPGVITYLTSAAGNAHCATKLQVEPAGSNPKSVVFSQGGSDITSGYRELQVAFEDTGAAVTLASQGTFQSGSSPCKIELSVGDWKQSTQGFLPIKIQVPPGAPFRFHWQNLDERSSSWRTKSSALPLLAFGSSASDEFSAQTIAISTLNPKTSAPDPPHFEARGGKQLPLTVLSFGINQNQLEINASGKGRVLRDGRVVSTVNALDTLNKNPILSALFAAGNLALIGWAGRMFFPSRPKRNSAL
ncbi:MAG: hypothetical protein WBL63_16245 [Candidatus Acidiferrum sp.]